MTIRYNNDIYPLFPSKVLTDSTYRSDRAYVVGSRVFMNPAQQVANDLTDEIVINGTSVPFAVGVSLNDLITQININPILTLLEIKASPMPVEDGVVFLLERTTPGDISITEGLIEAEPILIKLGVTPGIYDSGGIVPFEFTDEQDEQNVLTSLEILISHLRKLNNTKEAKLFVFSLSKMVNSFKISAFLEHDLNEKIEVIGNRTNPVIIPGDNFRVTVGGIQRTATISNASSLKQSINQINSQLAFPQIELSIVNRKIKVANTDQHPGVSFEIAKSTIPQKAGIDFKKYGYSSLNTINADNITDSSTGFLSRLGNR